MSRLKGVLSNPLLSVVMPVFNERTTIEEIIPRVLAVPVRIELIVVDDGSTDGTRDLLTALQKQHNFKLIFQPANGGKGAALRRGFQDVTGDLVVIQDADLEYSPEELPDLIELICKGRADVVYGSRFLGRHRVFLFTHYLGNRLLTSITNLLYNTMLTDMADNPRPTAKPKNAFEIVTVASARARQLLEGCVPKVEGSPKLARRALQEVSRGAVTRTPATTEK